MSDKENILVKLLDKVQYYKSIHEKFVLGRVLTIIDGSFNDLEQRKAVKDQVKDAFYNTNSPVSNEVLFSRFSSQFNEGKIEKFDYKYVDPVGGDEGVSFD